MLDELHDVYKELGFGLMNALADSLEGRREIIFNEEHYIYQTLLLPNNMKIRFTSWRKGTMPYYIILFNQLDNYVFELDLSMLVTLNGLFSWNLKIPSNSKNKNFLKEFLGKKQPFPNNYCNEVRKVKKALGAGVRVDCNGHLFANDIGWENLLDKFIVLMNKAIHSHSTVNDQKIIFGRKSVKGSIDDNNFPDIDQVVLEGNPRLLQHIIRERDSNIIQAKKQYTLRIDFRHKSKNVQFI